MNHVINHLSFGDEFPGQSNPLDETEVSSIKKFCFSKTPNFSGIWRNSEARKQIFRKSFQPEVLWQIKLKF